MRRLFSSLCVVLVLGCSSAPPGGTNVTSSTASAGAGGHGGVGGGPNGGGGQGGAGEGGQGGSPPSAWLAAELLPVPVSNNAVAAMEISGECWFLSAYGIGADLTSNAITADAFVRKTGGAWQAIAPVPSSPPRIAASAVALKEKFYVIGGYSVNNGGETSHAEVNVYDPVAELWTAAAPLPIAIDDAVALAWRNRYIVVISGWANTQTPVSDVQIYDSDDDTWALATPFPGAAVFGHAGAITGDTAIVIDGVGAGFSTVAQTYRATFDPNSPTTITWDNLGPHPGPARYRAAAGSVGTRLFFHGGTPDAYNFNGLTYAASQPAVPLATTLVSDASFSTLEAAGLPKAVGTMDHRALPSCQGELHVIGGMVAGPTVTTQTWKTAPTGN